MIKIFSIVIFLFIGCSSNKEQQRNAMQEVMKEDFIAKATALNDLRIGRYASETISAQVKNMRNTKDKHFDYLPEKFRENYTSYIRHYETAVRDMDKADRAALRNMMKSFTTLSPIKLLINIGKNMYNAYSNTGIKSVDFSKIDNDYEDLMDKMRQEKIPMPNAKNILEQLPSKYTLLSEINSKEGWQTIFGFINGKSLLSFVAEGEWSITNNKSDKFNFIGKDKNPSLLDFRTDTKLNFGALICRISQQDEKIAPENFPATSPVDVDGTGFIECRINDNDLENNDGTIKLTINVQRKN